MEHLIIRQAAQDDAPMIVELYRRAGIESERSFTADEARRHFAVFAKYPNFRVFVAVAGGDIVGAYELLIMDNLAKAGRPSGVVEDVAVSPQHQGRGVGRALMAHARAQCQQAGCYKFVLSSGSSRTDAHRFYDGLGFERHGISFLATLTTEHDPARG
jgi:ribosomal protein S18 acetylase RimI-like enzyme